MNANKKSWAADRSLSVPVTLSDLERRDGKGETFSGDLRKYQGAAIGLKK